MSVTGLGTRDPPGGGGPGGAATPRGAAGRHSGRWESGGAGPGGQPHPVAVMQVGTEVNLDLECKFCRWEGANAEGMRLTLHTQ